MRVGIAFNLKDESAEAAGRPDDWQEEFDAPVTIRAIAAALRELGHTTVDLGDGPALARHLLNDPPDFVFNLAEGTGTSRSREARVPALCELLGIPCTGSDPLTLAASLDKDCARRLVASAGVKVPWGRLIVGDRVPSPADVPAWPVLVKPNWEGSSKGIRARCLVESYAQLPAVVAELRRDYGQPLLLEEFVSGEEVTVGLFGQDQPRVLGCLRVVPLQPTDRFVYSLEVKRDWEARVRYECPPQLPATMLARVEAAAVAAYRALSCRDVARIDFRIRDGAPYFLEANPLPGLNPETSDLIILAKGMGVSHAELVQTIFQEAVGRTAG